MALQFNNAARRQRVSVDPGRLDRRITVQYALPARDAAGGVTVDWYDTATLWASVAFLSGNRLYAADEKSFEALVTYRIRHRGDVETGMRLIHGDDTFEIVSVEQLGRRHFLDLTCRAIDQSIGESGDDLDLGDGVTLFDLGNAETTLNRGGDIAA